MNREYLLKTRLVKYTSIAVSFALLLLLFIGMPLSAQSSLQELAAPKKIYIGNIISNAHLNDPTNFRNGLADSHLREEYNTMVLENYMKMSFVLPSTEPANIHELTVEQLKETLTTENIEAFLSNPDWASLRKRGHAMIWFNQAPNWLNLAAPTWTGQQVFDFSRKYILALGQICGNRVEEWDVINEAISDDAPNGQRQWRQGTWYRRANDGSMTDWGEATYENYIKMLFVWVREAQPQARLYINDYAIENFNTSPASKNRFIRDKAKALKACGAPIDGVGFQSHLVLSDMVAPNGIINQGFINSVEQSIEDLASAEVEVAITELDIRICNNDRDEDLQEAAYQAYCEMALSQPNCHEVVLWGLRDEDNWITSRNDPPFTGCQDAGIVEGDNYSPKAGYDGLAAAIQSLPNQNDFGFSPLVAGNGAPANCGGEGMLIPDLTFVSGPNAVSLGEQVMVEVSYVATDNQDVVLWFQLDAAPFTIYSQVITDVKEGTGTITIPIDIPMNVAPLTFEYRFLAFITPDGRGVEDSFSDFIQNRVTVLGEDSQLIISSLGPESVSPGETVEVNISYSAVENQQIVVWFQLDQSPFTTYQEFRQTASTGRNEMIAKVNIPPNVPIAKDAYQFQTILVPRGGGWPERISNIAQPNIDVVMLSSVTESNNNFKFELYPNPSSGIFTVELPEGNEAEDIIVYSALGEVIHQQRILSNTSQVTLYLDDIPSGLYWLAVHRGTSYGVVKLLKQ